MRWFWVCVLMMGLAGPANAQSADALFGADGYRVSHYRGPVHEAPQGVHRIDAATLAGLGGRPLLLDVVPAEGGYRDDKGNWHLSTVRETIPGAHWFPEAGRGTLSPDIARWFAQGVRRLTGGRRHRMIVTFCLADCWMSWNAARRLRAMGYTNVWWLAEGTDGWRESGQRLVKGVPEGN
ncbi:MAG: rhodanese [Sphingomonadales bacterium]|nr:rhodanese [Sphingomonadales bacterium]MDE2168437.1 rhodanese [Sphingomonadales bacterium]